MLQAERGLACVREERPNPLRVLRLALAALAFIPLAALAVEVTNGYGEQRLAQRAADLAAASGARILADAQACYTGAGCLRRVSNAEVLAAIDDAVNGPGMAAGYVASYVDANGTPLVDVSRDSLPVPPRAAGVRVVTSRTFATYFGGILSVQGVTVSASARPSTSTLTRPPRART